jgi:hypothetical protein
LDAQIRVAVDRGKSVSAYELQPPSDDTQVFTKCGTSAPEVIHSALDFGDGELWLAGQFDRPFLLDETGSQIARVLGELTNVTMIYASVRELNRRAAAAKQNQTALSVELEQVKEKLRGYVDLRAQVEACGDAEISLERALRLSEQRRSLVGCVVDADNASDRVVASRAVIRPVPDVSRLTALASARDRLAGLVSGVSDARDRRDSVSIVSVPDVVELAFLAARRAELARAIEELSGVVAHLVESRALAVSAVGDSAQARDRLGTVLLEAGVCPVCGADAVHAQMERVGH